MEDKVGLLVEETGCEPAEAELALQMAGYEAPAAVRLLAARLRHILVIKIKFRDLPEARFGLALIVANVKTGEVLRSRAVISFNPAVYAAHLDGYWFEFEKELYARRLWEGSLQTDSLDIENTLSQYFGRMDTEKWKALYQGTPPEFETELTGVFSKRLSSPNLELKLKKEILDLGEFNSLRTKGVEKRGKRRFGNAQGREHLVLKIDLEEDTFGIRASEIKAGDMISALVADSRDIAHYLWKIFGGYIEGSPISILAPVEASKSPLQGFSLGQGFPWGFAETPRFQAIKS